jgi:hypothetical protein
MTGPEPGLVVDAYTLPQITAPKQEPTTKLISPNSRIVGSAATVHLKMKATMLPKGIWMSRTSCYRTSPDESGWCDFTPVS